jgi:hypothetical protein
MIGLAILAGFGLLSAVEWVRSGKIISILSTVEVDLYCVEHLFARLLDERGKVKLSGETVKGLKDRAERKFSNETPADSASYQEGLRDGETLTAQYVLGTLQNEETK